MKAETLAAAGLAIVIAAAAPPILMRAQAQPTAPPAADNLILANSLQLRRVYLAPGADFRRFNKIMLEPTQVAFAENWIRDFNRDRSLGSRITDRDAERIRGQVSTGLGDTFARAFRGAGYQVVTAPGPDVLRVATKVANLAVTAPDLRTPGRAQTFAESAGEATLIIEVRDSRTNALYGRALDRRVAGNARMSLRNSVTNRADFRRVGQIWAQAFVEDMAALKAASPVKPGVHPR